MYDVTEAVFTIAPRLSEHRGKDRAKHEEGAPHVDVHHAVPVLQRIFVSRCRGTRDPGVVHQYVDSSEAAQHRLDEPFDRAEVGDVACDRRDATGPQSRGLLLAAAHIRSEDIRAFIGQPSRYRTSDAGAGAGDDRDPVDEPGIHAQCSSRNG